MQIAPHRWDTNFRTALTLLGRSVTRLPFGVDEPVLVGVSALELYSGGAWSYGALELVMDQPRVLNAALMAEGFRWTDRPRHVTPGLWHPQLQFAVEVVAHVLPDSAADPLATLTVELDAMPGTMPGTLRLRVIGIEDLIVEHAVAWVARGGSRVELAHQTQVLMELGQAGIGGPLRIDYLRRRVADATAGEVELGVSHPRSTPGHERARRITETAMLAAIHAWRARRGLSAPMAGCASCRVGGASSPRNILGRNERAGREGDLETPALNVLAFERPSYPQRR